MKEGDSASGAPAPNTRRRVLRDFLGGGLVGGLAAALLDRAHGWRTLMGEAESPGNAFELLPGLDHDAHMLRAIAQARKVPKLPFGAVIVRRDTGQLLAEGHNRSAVSPTYHGEIDVINRLAAEQPGIDWNQLVLYTTAEPCPMCQSAIAWAGIGGVVYGSSIPFLTGLGWHQIDIRAVEVARRTPFQRTVVAGGILETQCNALFESIERSR
jgi:tRNA(adenine34) deaminase